MILEIFFCGFLKVNLTENEAKKEACLSEVEVELVRSQAACAHLTEVCLPEKGSFVGKEVVNLCEGCVGAISKGRVGMDL